MNRKPRTNKKMGNKSILQCHKSTRERFNQFKKKYSEFENPNDEEFLIEIMDYVEENLGKEEN